MEHWSADRLETHAIGRAPRPAPFALALLVLTVAAVALRAGQFGNPLAGFDEQYYLLVGSRMWDGALPYVDLWDRKPIGLFLLFAAMQVVPGDGVLAAHLGATAFAIVTAMLLVLFSRRETGWTAATLGGLFYLVLLGQMWGDTTQSPVFYNALVAGAALLTARAAADPFSGTGQRRALLLMLLAGLAIQIKTVALLEGAWFGLWLVYAGWRRSRGDVGRTVSLAAWLALVGALPTLMAITGYALLDHGEAWWQANVLSVLAKPRPADLAATGDLLESLEMLVPVAALAVLGLWQRTERFRSWRQDTVFLLGWIVVAAFDFAAVGGYYPHHALPLLLACCPLVAHAARVGRLGVTLVAMFLLSPVLAAALSMPRAAAQERAIARHVTAALPADVRSRCLLVYRGPVAYYQLSHACLVTRFPFTAHLSSRREAPALGVDPMSELRAAFERRPGTVLALTGEPIEDRNPAVHAELLRQLRAHYRLVRLLPHRAGTGGERLLMWRRLDLLSHRGAQLPMVR